MEIVKASAIETEVDIAVLIRDRPTLR